MSKLLYCDDYDDDFCLDMMMVKKKLKLENCGIVQLSTPPTYCDPTSGRTVTMLGLSQVKKYLKSNI